MLSTRNNFWPAIFANMKGSLGLHVIPNTSYIYSHLQYVMFLTSKYMMESHKHALANKSSHYINHNGVLHLVLYLLFNFFLSTVMHIISITDFPLFCSNSAQKCLILPAECSPQKSLILLEILPAKVIQAYMRKYPSFFLKINIFGIKIILKILKLFFSELTKKTI